MFGPDGSPPDHMEQELRRLLGLCRDLDRLRHGLAPTVDEMSAAPLLDCWSVSVRPATCLVGAVSGHPNLRGPLVRTSDLWAINPARGWARTLSRFYRLGIPGGAVLAPHGGKAH